MFPWFEERIAPMDSDTAHELHVSRYTYDQEWIVAVDLGMFDVSDEAVTIDVVNETAIIVADPPDGRPNSKSPFPIRRAPLRRTIGF